MWKICFQNGFMQLGPEIDTGKRHHLFLKGNFSRRYLRKSVGSTLANYESVTGTCIPIRLKHQQIRRLTGEQWSPEITTCTLFHHFTREILSAQVAWADCCPMPNWQRRRHNRHSACPEVAQAHKAARPHPRGAFPPFLKIRKVRRRVPPLLWWQPLPWNPRRPRWVSKKLLSLRWHCDAHCKRGRGHAERQQP